MAGNLGLSGAFASGSLQAMLRQRMQDKIDAELRARKALNEDRTFGLAQQRQGLDERALQSQDALRQATLQASQANQSAQEQDRVFKENQTLNESTPADTVVGPSSPIFGRLMSIGALRDKGIQAEAPPAAIAENPDAPPQDIPGTIENAPMPSGRLYRKNATEKQQANDAKEAQAKAETDRRLAAEADTKQFRSGTLARQQGQDAETARHNKAMENKATNPSVVAIQTVDDKGNPVTRMVPKVAGAEFAKPPSAVTANRLDSAKVVVQTGDDMIAEINQMKAQLGPLMGRAGSFRDFIGNPPPEFSHLAGQIESYALANMGVHGMRSKQGADDIKLLLDQKHTPESLINAIQGVGGFSRHFLENAGRGNGSDQTQSAVEDWVRDASGKLVRQPKKTP